MTLFLRKKIWFSSWFLVSLVLKYSCMLKFLKREKDAWEMSFHFQWWNHFWSSEVEGWGGFFKESGWGGGPPGLRMDFDLISNDLSNLKSFLKSWTVSFLNPRICVLFFPSSGDLSWKIDKFGGHWQQSPLPNHLSNHIHSLCVCACWQPRETVCVCEGGGHVSRAQGLWHWIQCPNFLDLGDSHGKAWGDKFGF